MLGMLGGGLGCLVDGLKAHQVHQTPLTQSFRQTLGHRERRTTAIYAHLDLGVAAQGAYVIAVATAYRAELLQVPTEADANATYGRAAPERRRHLTPMARFTPSPHRLDASRAEYARSRENLICIDRYSLN